MSQATSTNRIENFATVKGKQSDDITENLVALFRDFLENAPNSTTFDQNRAKSKTLFGLSKRSSPKTGSNNRFDYEQKYPKDRRGEELGDNARVWLTYIDEAEGYDREKVEGWKETVDVLLVFAGLFSGVITTFVSQASQSLRQDNTQVSAVLLFEIAQILRAQFNGTSVTNIPASTLTPTSTFRPSTNAFLVNGLLFTSLAITLSTALFAVLTKQWLCYYLSSISGTARENARARQMRFKGFELWKVGAIVDLLPILLHLAVGVFLSGVVILLFPLDVRVAWTIVAISGTTYVLYFISVLLPIRYPGCPYTSSLTIYLGVLLFLLREVINPIMYSEDGHKPRLIGHLFQSLYKFAQRSFFFLVGPIGHSLRALGGHIFTQEAPKFTNWREENIRGAIKNATSLDIEALDWLYKVSSNTSVRRIIARCVSAQPDLTQKFEPVLGNLWDTLEVDEMNLADLCYGLPLDLQCDYSRQLKHWYLLRSIKTAEADHQDEESESYSHVAEAGQLDKVEYKSYSRVAEYICHRRYVQILENALSDEELIYPMWMWRCFFERASGNATVAARILTSGQDINLFDWKFYPTQASTPTGFVSFNTVLRIVGEPRQWIINYLFRYLELGAGLECVPENKSFDSRYLLLVSLYRKLITSQQPLIADAEQRQKLLYRLFGTFREWLHSSKPRHLSHEQYFIFFKDIFCADADGFWNTSMTYWTRVRAAECLDSIWNLMDTRVANHFPLMECHAYDLSLVFAWCSRDLEQFLIWHTTPMFVLLLAPQNHARLCTILSRDSDAVYHLKKCFHNLWESRELQIKKKYLGQSLKDLFRSIDSQNLPLFDILYDPSVLVQIWKVLVFPEPNEKKFLFIVEEKLGPEKLSALHDDMNTEAHSIANTRISQALIKSAREFGQLKSVSNSENWPSCV